MCIVNVKVKYIRPKYNNLYEWMKDPNNIYIGRKGIVFIDGIRFPKQDSIWCNPYKISKQGGPTHLLSICETNAKDMNREEALLKYKSYIENIIKNDDNIRLELIKLKGKNLGFWCKPDKCHGDLLVDLLSIM